MYAYLEKLGCIVRYFVNVSSDGRIGMSGHVEIIELESERKNETYVLHVYKPFPSSHRNSFPSNFSIKKFPTHRHTQTHIDSFWFSRVNVRLLFFFFLSNPLKRRVGDVPIRVYVNPNWNNYQKRISTSSKTRIENAQIYLFARNVSITWPRCIDKSTDTVLTWSSAQVSWEGRHA